jgi:hypothetical protein
MHMKSSSCECFTVEYPDIALTSTEKYVVDCFANASGSKMELLQETGSLMKRRLAEHVSSRKPAAGKMHV